ncbi:MAG: helix-turn-helix domain-containing protein, partial [Treponema sp.]|nr:helix-turn-helix domain-containing protein [Treponema sp.]
LSRNIRQFRVISALSQEKLAEKAGISVPFLGAIERGEKWPSPETFANIAYGLGVEPYDLMKPENISAQDVRKIVVKLARDMSVLVNQSVKMLNTVARESGGTGGKGKRGE